ncbi:AraC-like DNA-binding protein [Sphingomonas sp. UYAg733]
MSISDAARESGYNSRTVFSKAFRRDVGTSATEWKVATELEKSTRDRVAEAEEMLLSGDHTIASAAKALDYNNSQGLAKAFARVYGMSPTTWLKWAKGGVRIRFAAVRDFD